MNKPWPVCKSRHLTGLVLGAILLLANAGCYGGWNRAKMGPSEPGDKSVVSKTKPYAYILLDAIVPSLTPGRYSCGDGDSPLFYEYRQDEWMERGAALVEALKPLADTFLLNKTEIDGDNCTTMRSLETQAQSIRSGLPQEADPRGRPVLHIRAVFWAGRAPDLTKQDLPGTFSLPWLEWQLGTNGSVIHLFNINYFVLSNSYSGIFRNWFADNSSGGTAAAGSIAGPTGGAFVGYINSGLGNVDPTDQATAQRKTQIQRDTAAFLVWLQQTTGISP